jgi:hypothetical protein
VGDKSKGLYNKFNVERTDGKSEVGQKHFRCDYFVLDLTGDHDPFALPALKAYAEACKDEYPALYVDLQNKIRRMESKAASAGVE